MTQKPVMHFNCNLMIALKYKYNSKSNIKTMYLQRHAFFLYLICKEIKIFYKTDYWDGVKKTSKLQTKIVFLRKEKKMQNVLERKHMYFEEKICEIFSFGPASFGYAYQKIINFFFQKSEKNGIGGGISERHRLVRNF